MTEKQLDIQPVVVVGDKVTYHGSQEGYHGTYFVAFVPDDPEGRGFVLSADQDFRPGASNLWHVHRDSFTLAE